VKLSGHFEQISGRKIDGFNQVINKKKSLKPSNINGFKDFLCGTPEGIRTPDLLVRSSVDSRLISPKQRCLGLSSSKISAEFSFGALFEHPRSPV